MNESDRFRSRERVPAFVAVEYKEEQGSDWKRAVCENISSSGLFLRGTLDLKKGTLITIKFSSKITLQGRVAWTRADASGGDIPVAGAGIAFQSVSDQHITLINEIMDSFKSQWYSMF